MKRRLEVPAITTRSRSEGSVVSFAEEPIPIPPRSSGRDEESVTLGPSTSAGPSQASWRSSGSHDLVVALDSFSFVDAALQDPDRTSTTLADAAIRLQIAMSKDEGILSTLTLATGERKRTMQKLLAKILREAQRLDEDDVEEETQELGEAEDVEMEEDVPVSGLAVSISEDPEDDEEIEEVEETGN